MNILKKKTTIGLIILLFLLLIPSLSHAASFSVSSSKTKVTVGDTFTVTISASGLTGKFSISGSSNVSLNKTSDWAENSSISVTCKALGTGTATITATASDVADSSTGASFAGSKSVSVTISAVPIPPDPSTFAYLTALSLDDIYGLTPSFSKTTYSYTASVNQMVTDLTVNYTAENPKSTVAVSGNTNLQLGDNPITVKVTSQDGKTVKTYTITVTKAVDPALADATLASLTVDNYPFLFDPNTEEYDIGTIDSSLTSLNVTAVPTDSNEVVVITGADDLQIGENTITITVTSEDGTVIKEYTIKYNRPDPNAVSTITTNLFDNIKNFVKDNWLVLTVSAAAFIELIVIIILAVKLSRNKNGLGKH